MSNVMEVIKERSSTRGYTSEPLTAEELNALIHAGLQAPTAANRQEIHFTVLNGDNPILAELEEEKTACAKSRRRCIISTMKRPPSSYSALTANFDGVRWTLELLWKIWRWQQRSLDLAI